MQVMEYRWSWISNTHAFVGRSEYVNYLSTIGGRNIYGTQGWRALDLCATQVVPSHGLQQ